MKNKNGYRWIWCICIASLMLSICSRSSFLYPYNDWNDAQSFFTMGKAMMRGQVLYRDLFEQKGPYLYLIYGVASMISYQSFLGVFILEILSLSICLFFGCKTLEKFCCKQIAWLLIPVMAFGVCASKSFYWGGSAEEFCLPFLAYGIYVSLKCMKNKEVPATYEVILNGICAGIVALIKYTLLGFYFAWIMAFLIMLLFEKKWKECIRAGLHFLAGMVLAFVPWLIYFGINHALDDWYHCYIFVNIFLYGGNAFSRGIGQKIYELAKIFYWLIWDNWMYLLPVMVGMIGLLFFNMLSWMGKTQVYAMFGLLFVGIFVGEANLIYYSLPLSVFAVYGLGIIGIWIEKLAFKGTNFLMAASLALSVLTSFAFSDNISAMKKEKEDIFLTSMAEIINQEDNPTLLNYGCLDAGLYTVAGLLPSCKYYHRCNILYEEMERVQNEYVHSGKTQFVLSRDAYPNDIEQQYELVLSEKYEQSGQEFVYHLFKRKE